MDRSQRLTDGTRWRTFMLLLLFDDMTKCYTNARPGVFEAGSAGRLVGEFLPVSRANRKLRKPGHAEPTHPMSNLFSREGDHVSLRICMRRKEPQGCFSGGPLNVTPLADKSAKV